MANVSAEGMPLFLSREMLNNILGRCVGLRVGRDPPEPRYRHPSPLGHRVQYSVDRG